MKDITTKAVGYRKYAVKTLLCAWFNMFFALSLCAQTYNWGSVAIGGGGFVSSIVTSKTEKNLMYARTDVGGAYRWNAATERWIPLNDWASDGQTGYLGAESIASDPQSPNKVYMLMGISYFNNGNTAIFRSNDYGNTFSLTDVSNLWKAHGNGMGRQNGEKLQVDPNNGNILFCGSRRNGLFKSTDAGASWARVNSLNITSTPNDVGISFVYLDPSSGTKGNATQNIYVGVSRTASPNVYVSKDGGNTFNPLTGSPNAGFMPQRVSAAKDGIMYINFANGAGPNGNGGTEPMGDGGIWKYNSKNGNWTNVTPSGISKAWGGISVDPANSNRVIASTINNYQIQGNQGYGDRIYLSTNGGSSWIDVVARGHTLDPNGCTWINGHAIHWAGSVEFDPFDVKKVYITSGNGIFSNKNIDVASTPWKFEVKGLEETVPLDLISIPNGPLFSVIGDYDGFRHANINEYALLHNPRTGTSTGIAYAPLNTNKVLRVGNAMFYSSNQGNSWTGCSSMGAKGKVAISANGNIFLHSPETGNTTYRSINNGSSWTPVNGLNFSGGFPKADPVNSNKFYTYGNGTMYVSTDGGINFAASGSPGAGGSDRIETVPGREGHLWVAMQNSGLSRTVNSGASFSKINTVSRCSAVGIGKAAPGSTYGTIYIYGTVNNVRGIFRSINEGATWTRINDDAHEYGGPGNGQFVIGDNNTYGTVYMSTAGRGIAYGTISTFVTSIYENSLEGNVNSNSGTIFPNPFQSKFAIKNAGDFEYAIYDIDSKLLETGNGQNEITIGNSLLAGVYIVKIKTGEETKFIKVVKH